MLAPDPQSELILTRAPNRVLVPIELVRTKKSAGAAFTLACDASGLDDKEIYLAIGIDPGYFANIKKDKATLQGNLVERFCEVVGNTIYLEWLAFRVGCTLVLIQTEAERRAAEAIARARELEKENRLLRELVTGKAPRDE